MSALDFGKKPLAGKVLWLGCGTPKLTPVVLSREPGWCQYPTPPIDFQQPIRSNEKQSNDSSQENYRC